ncbi:hypothetical protein MKY96_07535 [Paenibacillus sp. FSL R7-0302]|uniref:hypothetical protein n=1 Tax=Paenibacillus sp. FSL R7-0302 TaxID=2921681 RepID=UPI0030F79B11
MNSAWSSGPDMVEKPTTFGAAEACGPNMVEKPTTFSAAEACGPDMVEKAITMGMPQAFCSEDIRVILPPVPYVPSNSLCISLNLVTNGTKLLITRVNSIRS